MKIALGSMMGAPRARICRSARPTTPRCTAQGPRVDEYRFTDESAILSELQEVWERSIVSALAELPDIELTALSDETAAPA